MKTLRLALYIFGVFALPVIGYYATLATFKVPPGDFLWSPLAAWGASLVLPTMHRVAKKPLIYWQVLLLGAFLSLAGFVGRMVVEPNEASVTLSRLYLDLALTPIFVHYGIRIGKQFAEIDRTPTVQPEEPRNLIHRISPEPQPESVVNVSQK